MKRLKTEIRGLAAIALSTPALELTVTTGVGPRILTLQSRQGRAGNLFLEMPVALDINGDFRLRGGHRLWHSPEHPVRTYQPDNDPLVVRELTNGLVVTQPTEAGTGLQKTVKIELFGQRTVKVTHTLANRGLWPVECAPWALTMFRPGGYGVLPLPPKGSHPEHLLPNYTLVPWSYTDLSLPVWDLHRDFIGIDVVKARTAQKLGITQYPGWSACWLDGTTFVKYARPITGASYPDFGCCFETFTNGDMLELETLAPLGPIPAGGRATHVENWTLLDGLRRPDTDVAFDKLASAVKTWLNTLR